MNAIFLQNQIHFINQFYHHNIYFIYFVIATYPLMVYILQFHRSLRRIYKIQCEKKCDRFFFL